MTRSRHIIGSLARLCYGRGLFAIRWGKTIGVAILVAALGIQDSTSPLNDGLLSQAAAQAPASADPLEGGIAWLNTENPLKLSELHGRVVLLDFWTLC